MDLLGDLGVEDQLTSARAENAVLQQKVKDLSLRVKDLTLHNQSLLAEVELYRNDNMHPNGTGDASTDRNISSQQGDDDEAEHVFVKSGDGIYPSDPAVTLSRLHHNSNPLCCALNAQDTILATGGADGHLSLTYWGPALAPSEGAAQQVVQLATRVDCHAPVIAACFATYNNHAYNSSSVQEQLVAAGCMDGSVHWMGFGQNQDPNHHDNSRLQASTWSISKGHAKYVKAMQFCPTAPLLATASADGKVLISKLQANDSASSTSTYSVQVVKSLHFHQGAVETLCFSDDGRHLYVYVRNTPYLSCFDVEQDFHQTKLHLNTSGVTGGFEDHVSFAVLDMATSPNNGSKYMAMATDTSRNIVMDLQSGKQLRNLYGHTNDGYSQPKIGWSRNGQYVLGNTQDDSSVCIWDVASSSIVKRLDESAGGHVQPIRDLFSSRSTDTLVTTSFDKQTKIWLQSV